MTALTTSPFLTLPPGMASLTVATMTSPMPAYRRPEPPRTRMQRISLAPVLSATRSRDSCWITVELLSSRWFSSLSLAERIYGHWPGGGGWPRATRLPLGFCLLGALEDLHHAPALGGRERAGLHDQDAVADTGRVGLVVRLDLVAATHDLAVERVLDAVLDLDHDGLVHLVADDIATTRLAYSAVDVGLLNTDAHCILFGLLAHAWPSERIRMPSSY